MANTALMPMPMIQFFSASGVPLAGGFIYTYAAGTSTPLATYQDSTGSSANTNPVVLDAGGFANIWLLAETYKIVAQDADAVEQWSQDNVSAVSIAELSENNSFASIAVSGNATIGGDLTVDGETTTASLDVTGAATIEGVLNAATAAISGNETVGGTLVVTGATTLDDASVGGDLTVDGAANLSTDVNIGADTLADFILATIPALGGLAGTAIITDVSTSGNWVIFTFGATASTKIKIALGAITLPSGFNTTNLFVAPSIGSVATTPGNQLDQFSVSCTAGVISVAASDNSGHNFTPTANWFGVAWLTGQ
jgi:cytoskeletal protein CcmA (bactofilin family)